MSETTQQNTESASSGGGFPPAMSRRNFWIALSTLVLLTLAAYSAVFPAGFNWDDDAHVIAIGQLASLDGLYRIWFEPGATVQYYPLVFSAFWAQINLWGLDPLGFHLVNIVLHTGNALLFWLCLTRLKIPGAFWAACIFALHPVNVESVAWVTELKNVLAAFFYLLAFLSYWRFAELLSQGVASRQKIRLCYAAALMLFLFALLSKTVTCTLPAAILVVLWWKRGRVEWRQVALLLPFFILAILMGAVTIRLEVHHLMAKGPEWDFSIIDRFLIAGRVLWFYLWKLLWPHPLVFNYPRWQINAREWWQYLFPLGIVAILPLLWHYRDKAGRGLLAASLLFIGTHFPVLGFINVYWMRFSFVADHFQYIACFAVIALSCAAISLALNRFLPSFKYGEPAVFGAILLALSLLTWQQGKIYKDKWTLFNDTIARNPASWLSYANRAVEYLQQGRDDLAMADLDRTVALNPYEADAFCSRGALHMKRKNFAAAFADFDRAIATRPWRIDYLRNRSQAYRFVGELDKALIDADRIIRLAPDDVRNYQLRASIYAQRKDYEPALRDLNLALQLDPEDFLTYSDRGLVYYRQGRLPQAIGDFDEALRISPDSAETWYNRGVAQAAAGSLARAGSDLNRARELGYRLEDAEIRRILSAGKR